MNILYFAWIRERLNKGSEQVSPPDDVGTIAELINWMASQDEAFAFAFEDKDIIRASIDDELVEHNASIKGASEIAFFPPMTGG